MLQGDRCDTCSGSGVVPREVGDFDGTPIRASDPCPSCTIIDDDPIDFDVEEATLERGPVSPTLDPADAFAASIALRTVASNGSGEIAERCARVSEQLHSAAVASIANEIACAEVSQ